MWYKVNTPSEDEALCILKAKRAEGRKPIFGRRPFGYYVAWHEADVPYVPSKTKTKVAYI